MKLPILIRIQTALLLLACKQSDSEKNAEPKTDPLDSAGRRPKTIVVDTFPDGSVIIHGTTCAWAFGFSEGKQWYKTIIGKII
jgi:hypothetical protein